ncbi:MAG TPA: tetratricopeptide repeat protein [Candidatus Angelobacter sp.]|jgi:tetratricopeptide (TPR) repeat protein|nr:tetratricopeptide repeat protein [Candidatus Angelobacter sp.]
MRLIPGFPSLVLDLALAICLSAAPASAQKSGGSKGGSGSHATPAPAPVSSSSSNYRPRSAEGEFDNKVVYLSDDNHPILKNDLPGCYQWPMSPVLSSTVSVTGLDISAEARQQFNDGCASIQKKNLKDAEQHLSRVVKLNPKYAAAWVLLGQTNKDQGNMKEAEKSCTQAREADASYLPGYLCLAALAAREDKWDQVADLTNQVIGMHPVRAPGATYYNGVANYYLKQWTTAEKSALMALQDSSKTQKSELHWLLAKIYEQKHDRDAEAAQLREYLSLAPDGPDAAVARRILKQIQVHAAK